MSLNPYCASWKSFLKKSLYLATTSLFGLSTLQAYADRGYVLHEIAKEKQDAQDYKFKMMMGLTTSSDFNPMSVIQNTFTQKLDHTSLEDTRTFEQRYFVYSDYAKGENAPVFLYIGSEAELSGISPYRSYVQQAKKYNAHVIALEHRYYGQSQPFDELTAENLQYLNTDAVLADLANFQTQMMQKHNWNGPWIAFGGSYGANISAYYRLKHPELVAGALASSGPVEAKLEFVEYDENTTNVAGPKCRDAIREVTRYVESVLDNPTEMLRIKKLFNSEHMKSDVAMLFLLSELSTEAIQYGQKENFCHSLLTSEDRLEGFAKGGLDICNYLGVNPIDFTAEGSLLTQTSNYTSGVGMRQWFWQVCTEYAFFYTAHPNPELSTRSPLINLDYFMNECDMMFGIKETVDVENTNSKYYDQLLSESAIPQASNIFFTNGSDDPWQHLSITKERGNDTNPDMSYMTIPDAAHCDDLRVTEDQKVQTAQKHFESLLDNWLDQK